MSADSLAPALLAAALLACATWLAGPFGSDRGAAGDPTSDPGAEGSVRRSTGTRGSGAEWFGLRRIRQLVVGPGRGGFGESSEVSSRDVASALVLLALGYRSGLPTTAVLTLVAEELTPSAAQDLRQVTAALQWGASEAEAWASVHPAWSPAARAIRVAHEAGIPPGSLLLRASDDLRHAEVERLEVAAAKAGVRLVMPLGLVLLPAFCLTTVVPLVVALGGELLAGR